jgi:taurine transport system permease protein
LFLPSPAAVWQLSDYALGQANDQSLWAHLGPAWGGCCWPSAGLRHGHPAGIAMGSSRWARGVLDPLLEFYRPLPPLAYLPLIIIWCGINELPKVLLIYLSCFAPLALAARSGMRQASAEQIHAAASMGPPWQLVRHVLLPAALPEILVGMRIAIGFGWTTLVAAEMVAANLAWANWCSTPPTSCAPTSW